MLDAQAKSSSAKQKFRVLVDTGAKIPLAFRQGLFAQKYLRKANFPVRFTTADGQHMNGGNYGLFIELMLPIWREGRLINAQTCSLFAYEADIHGVDIIMGYPFLKVFNICVDAQHDRLAIGLEDPKPKQDTSNHSIATSMDVQPTETLGAPAGPEPYEVSKDVELRAFFGCTCAVEVDKNCPLAMFHHNGQAYRLQTIIMDWTRICHHRM